MGYVQELQSYCPANEQETTDQATILSFIHHFPENVLLRQNTVAHITSSGFIVNPDVTRVLLAHHNIRGVWGWSGGHADGDEDLRAVALREAKEETGIWQAALLSPHIASLDVLPVLAHTKNSAYVGAHLHLSVAYLLVADDTQPLRSKPDENSAVAWFDIAAFTEENFAAYDVYLYNKLIKRAQKIAAGQSPA